MPAPVPMNNATLDRVNDQDRAILDLKARMRNIRKYQDKLSSQEESVLVKIKQLMTDGQKKRAML